MHIDLTKEELRELIVLLHIGRVVRDAGRGEGAALVEDAVESKILEKALSLYVAGIEERSDGSFGLDEELDERAHRALDSFIEEVFWDELEERLGDRDFDREAVRPGGIPESRERYQEKYRREFESFGLDRLEISKDAPVTDLRDAL